MENNNFQTPGPLEENKTMQINTSAAIGSQREVADYMLSQDSIKHTLEAADLETIEEREKLQGLERERKEFAKKLKERQDQEFREKQDQTK